MDNIKNDLNFLFGFSQLKNKKIKEILNIYNSKDCQFCLKIINSDYKNKILNEI